MCVCVHACARACVCTLSVLNGVEGGHTIFLHFKSTNDITITFIHHIKMVSIVKLIKALSGHCLLVTSTGTTLYIDNGD